MISHFCTLLVLIMLVMILGSINAASVNEGEVYIQRKLVEIVEENDKARYEYLLSRSAQIRKEIVVLSRLLPDADASNRIKDYNEELQQIIRDTLEINQQSMNTESRGYAAERAVERARQRDAVRREAEAKKRREEEDLTYIQNMRKMQLVENTVAELQSRAAFHGLDEYGTNRVNELLNEYRVLEADYIFNGTNVQAAQTQRRFIEKFIGDSQAIEITNKQRQKELLDRTIQELAARGVNFMCRSEMKMLDEMLATYRDFGFRLIELSNSKGTSSLTDEIAAAQKATQSQKLLIEKYIGNTKVTSKCANVAKRHFQPKGLSA